MLRSSDSVPPERPLPVNGNRSANRIEVDSTATASSATASSSLLLSAGAVESLLQQAPHTSGRPTHLLQPEIDAVYACGYYVSVQSPEMWSDLVRRAKHPTTGDLERERLLSLVCDAFCNFVALQTPLFGPVDAIVAIPANPARLELRGMSLPDELGRAVQDRFGLPFLTSSLHSVAAPGLQMRGLEFEKRSSAVKGLMVFGERAGVVDRTILLVDDVVCSGSTLREAARLLLGADASRIYAACIASCL